MTIRILEKWDMETPVAQRNEWFGDWLNRRPNEVSRHITMGWHALQELRSLQDVQSVHESFGGIGAQALIAEELWPTARHTVRDYSSSAVRYMVENLPMRKGLHVFPGSSYDPDLFVTADVQLADVGDLTATRMNQFPYRAWLDHTFGSGAKAVVLTDIAGRLLHLHRETYSRDLGVQVETYEQYLGALGHFVLRRYGYAPTKTFYHRWSSITVFRPRPDYQVVHYLTECPATPIGLEVLK